MQNNHSILNKSQDASEKDENLVVADSSEEMRHNDCKPVVSVEEYRKKLNDYESTDQQIICRLEYIEALCRDVIQQEIETYAEKDN